VGDEGERGTKKEKEEDLAMATERKHNHTSREEGRRSEKLKII